MSGVEYKLQAVYCPRCDKPFVDYMARKAFDVMEEHLEKAHPDYFYGMYEKEENEDVK